MKKGILLLAFFSLLFSAYSQTLFTYGNHPVTISEFLRAYNKNKTASPDEEKALRDYLDLYTLFKLKVQAAKDLHLDTLPALQADLQNFRNQIEENYLKDDKRVEALMDEAFARSQKDIHVVNFFVEAPANTDTTIYFKAINEVSQELKSNKSIKEILEKVNTNGVNVVANDFGFITVFTLPYEFENVVYGLKPGESSAVPYRTKKGWHIFKNVEERHAVGKIKISQILLAAPAGFIDERERTKKLADSIYNVLQQGADFGEMAKEFSNDRATYFNGGEMPEFGVAKYNPAFEKAAFSLTKDDEISQPFETEFGYHILKRIAATPVPSKNEEAFMYHLKQEVLKDSRMESAKRQFIKEILPKTGYKKMEINEPDLWRVSDSSLMANKNITSGKVNEKTVLFSYNDQSKVNVSDWILFVRNSNKIIPGKMHESYTMLWPEFISFSAIENYRKRLQNFSPEFKDQLQEFKDGNMLFEVMERKVWGKAAADSAGLLQFYNRHQQKYAWNASAGVIIFSCANENVARESSEELQKGKMWKDVMNDHSSQVQADSGRYELAQIPVVDKTNFSEGLITQPVVNKNDGTAVFTKIIKLYPPNQQRSFEDARGLVINDYQHFLEEKWITQLKKQYPIKVNAKAFQALVK